MTGGSVPRGPHISNLNVLLPPRSSRPVHYHLQGYNGCFTWFDTIFGTSATNADIYNEQAKDLVRSAVSGFNDTVHRHHNCTIHAYGQTSSGKTYTMQGSGSDPGVTRLAIRDVFTNIEKIEDREFLIRVSYMEIYNEEINDLLAPENRKLQMHESIEDSSTGQILRCEVFIDKIFRIQIFHHSLKLDLDGMATLRIRAFDTEDNVFSSLTGLQFMWQLSPLSQTGDVAHRLTHVPLKHTSLIDGEIETQIELEHNVICYFPSSIHHDRL